MTSPGAAAVGECLYGVGPLPRMAVCSWNPAE